MKFIKKILKRLKDEYSDPYRNKTLIRVYIFVSRAMEVPNSPIVIYYSSDKQHIYNHATKNKLRGHIKEDIYPIEEFNKVSTSPYWLNK